MPRIFPLFQRGLHCMYVEICTIKYKVMQSPGSLFDIRMKYFKVWNTRISR